MARVGATVKVMPDGPKRDLQALRKSLASKVPVAIQLQGFREEPVAFGLRALIASVTLEDAEGGTDALEEAWSRIEGVQSVQVLEVSRLQ
ncbi:MAG: elongation factor 1-beta [Halobacteria archaeon]